MIDFMEFCLNYVQLTKISFIISLQNVLQNHFDAILKQICFEKFKQLI
jgi:hypothetical protein